jgi:iron complex outermembrane recepter protein
MSVPNHMRMTALAIAFNRGDINVTQRAADQDNLFRLSPIAAGAAVLIMALGSAHAQTTPSTQPATQTQAEKEKDGVQTITVTGIRRGIENAINVKKNSDSIVEAVSAEDIGKLPDSSIAESIARLPGLTAQRVNGRATEINIRGLSGDFANTLLNGREQTSVGNNRSVEFDQYPSELLSSVLVYKTPNVGLLGQGLSGTIDLQTVRPLSFGQRVIGINVRGEKNGKGTPFEGSGNRFNVSYIDQFADRTVGVALGFARLKQDRETARSETYGTNDKATAPGLNGGAEFTFNQGFKYFVDSTDETRDGAMAVLEFKPNKAVSSTLDIFYSKFDKEFVKRGLEIQVNDSWKGAGNFQFPTLTNPVFENNRLISGVWGNVNPLSRHIWEPRKDELNSVGWNTKWKFADQWTAVADVSFSSAKSVERITEIEAGQYDTANNRPLPENVTLANYNQITALQYDRSNLSTLRLTDPESWGQNGYDKTITTDDKLKSLRLSAQNDLDGLFARVDVGINYTQRDKSKGATEAFLRLIGRTNNNPAAPLPAGTSALALPGTGLTTIAFDPASALSAYRFDGNVNGDILRKGWTVNEKVTTTYMKGDLDTELFGVPLRGNVGVQVIHTDQRSTAPVVVRQNTFEEQTRGKDYVDFLPSANLIFDIGGDQVIRAGIGRQMARPRMDQLKNFLRSEVNDQGQWRGEVGNPELDPFRATAFDISYEKYFGTKGYVSAAGFYKNLKSYIFDFTQTDFNFTGFPNLSGRTATSPIGELKQTINGKGGTISGIEVAASVPLNLLTPMLDGFGVQASASYTDSKIKPFGDGDTRPLPGLSKNVTTLTAYYEKFGFSARVAARNRSKFIAEIEGFGADREYKFAAPETVTDLQFGYELQSGPAKGLNFLLQVNNVTNEPYRELDGAGNQTKLDTYGRTLLFGASYKF